MTDACAAALVRIRLDEPVGKGDLLELRHDDEFDQFLTVIAPDDAQAGDIIEARAARAMPQGAIVRLIRSQAALDEAAAALHPRCPAQARGRRIRPCPLGRAVLGHAHLQR